MRVEHPERVLAIAALLAGCGGGAEVLVVPFFTFGFGFTGDVAGQQRTVSLNLSPNEPTTATGTFEPTSNITMAPAGGFGRQHDVTGTWSGCTLALTVQDDAGENPPVAPEPPLARSYNGRFEGRHVIVLTPTVAGFPVLRLTRAFNNGPNDPGPNC
jgi:hypothetical protein